MKRLSFLAALFSFGAAAQSVPIQPVPSEQEPVNGRCPACGIVAPAIRGAIGKTMPCPPPLLKGRDLECHEITFSRSTGRQIEWVECANRYCRNVFAMDAE